MGLIVVNKRSWYAADQRAGALRPNFEAADQLNALELCDETQLPSLCDKKNKKLTWRAADQCAGALRLNEAADQLNALELCVAQLRCDMARRRPTRWSFAAKCSRRPTKRAGALRCAITLCASTHRDMFHVQKFMCQITDQRAGALRPRQGRRPTGYALELCEYGSGNVADQHGVPILELCDRSRRRRNRRPTRVGALRCDPLW